jgi:hypothetical protein
VDALQRNGKTCFARGRFDKCGESTPARLFDMYVTYVRSRLDVASTFSAMTEDNGLNHDQRLATCFGSLDFSQVPARVTGR